MRILKLIFASMVIFSIVVLFLFALFPAEISVSRLIQIRSTPAEVGKKIADLRDWNNWNELLQNAFDNHVVYAPATSDSNMIRRGYFSVELLKISPDTLVTRWKNKENSFSGNFILTEMNGQTVLEWTLNFHVKWYPWKKLASMFYDKQLGPVMENSLLKLKQELETKN